MAVTTPCASIVVQANAEPHPGSERMRARRGSERRMNGYVVGIGQKISRIARLYVGLVVLWPRGAIRRAGRSRHSTSSPTPRRSPAAVHYAGEKSGLAAG